MAIETEEQSAATTPNPERATQRRAAKMIAFNTWRQQWRAANPDGTREQRFEAWHQVRKAETKAAHRVLKALEKGGFKIVAAEA